MYSFLYIAYHFVALFYLASGFILLASAKTIERKIPDWFPFLESRHMDRMRNGLNLIVVGVILLIIGRWLVEDNIAGLCGAIFLSAWEVYLSLAFYRKRNETFSAAYHLVIHALIIIFVFYHTVIVSTPTKNLATTLRQGLASVFSVYYNK